MKNVKEQFIKSLIEELNEENERRIDELNSEPLDVCYMVSVIEQNIDKYDEFLNDISIHSYFINGYYEDTSRGYTNGKIRILIEKPEEEKKSEYAFDACYDYCYYIEFLYDERSWGYCQCSPSDEDYNEKHKCCGHGCDWYAPSFSLTKEIHMGRSSWIGDEHDYWNYEENFNKSEENKNKEVEEYNRKRQIEFLENRIKELQNELKELNDNTCTTSVAEVESES